MQSIPSKRIIVCPTTIDKGISIKGQRIVIEGTSCVISTTIDDVKLNDAAVAASTKRPPPPYTIVTAASANHLCALESFLYTLYDYRAQMENFPRVVVYNLGVNETSQLEVLTQLHNNGLMDELITFDYEKYPSFWDISKNAGEYGWKTAMVYEQAQKHGGLLVWMDAGNQVSAKFLYRLPSYIANDHGFWSPRSAYTMHRLTHPGMFEYFQQDPEPYAHYINCNGAAFGLDTRNQTIMDEIITPWYQCGLNKNCIAPPGSSRVNHRQDQAALTFLAYKTGHTCRWSAGYFKVQTHRDIACRAILLERDSQQLLYHPSTVDRPQWTPSDTFDLNNHLDWRYPQPKKASLHPIIHFQQEEEN
ncbi:uncharacterized protein BX664DRAFT_370939 [Halteromyces radiatus]|uniref:uncharacterized protein n=1 Tax=Halteromyces radiatus TaxID=101107 RepID=UPI002220185D|nr:uncharacterized protein BX664DRAFT_370939 [Halteromyces radiatus]KAI8097362.1 hypothetical protein BX664DRAFT_370939 [Halteromyces radiatus]